VGILAVSGCSHSVANVRMDLIMLAIGCTSVMQDSVCSIECPNIEKSTIKRLCLVPSEAWPSPNMLFQDRDAEGKMIARG
jgi:hypothetical protein